MYKNINIYGNYYLVPDLDPPERKRLLDRLEIDADDIKKTNILNDRENRQWCISGKRIVNDSDFPQGYKENVKIPVYTMSEVEDDQFKLSNGHYSAFFFTTENNMGKATEKMRELGLDYRSNRKDFETKNPSSLFLAFNNTVYPCNSEKRTQDTMDRIGLDWDNFYNPPEPIDELISEQRKDLKALEERCLSYISYFSRTLPICMEAAKNDPFNIKDIPGYLLTRKFISNIIEMNPINLRFIPAERLDKSLCIQAINKNSAALIGLDEKLKTPELCLMAVKQDGSLKKHVPKSIINDSKLNIYRFGMLVEEQMSLNFAQVKDLYEGKKVEIDYTEPTNQIPRKVQVEYNTQRGSLNYYDNVRDTKSMENKQQNKISDKGKGRKI